MHPVNLIASALAAENQSWTPPCATRRAVCCVTGEECECIPRRKLIGASFTTQAALAAPLSQWIGLAAARALSHRPERAACWWTDGRVLRVVKRPEIRALVLDGSPSAPWAGWVTTSYKKHGSLLARVNNTPRGVWAFDEQRVDCSDGGQVREWWTVMTAAQKAGISRVMQESGECPPGLMRKIGLRAWMDYAAWADPRRQSPLFGLLCYLLPSKEELAEDLANEP